MAFVEIIEKIDRLGLTDFFWSNFLTACSKLSATSKQLAENDIANLRDTLDDLNLFSEFSPGLYNVYFESQKQLFSILVNYQKAIEALTQNLHRLSRVMIRNRKREVLKGEMVSRKAYKVEVIPTPLEKKFYQQVSLYIKQSYARASSQENTAVGFVLTIFRKLLVSSPHALAVSLEKRAKKIEVALKNRQVRSTKISDDELSELDETIESVEDLDALFNLIGSGSPEEARNEIKKLRTLATQARNLPVDSKANKLLSEVSTLLQDNPSEKILIFTQFRETQNYLKHLFED